MLKKFLIFVAGAALAAFCIALWLPSVIPTGQDAKESAHVREIFIQAANTNVPIGDLHFIGSPGRRKTQLIVVGRTAETNKTKLRELAKRVEADTGRKINIEFRDEGTGMYLPTNRTESALPR